MKPSNSIRIAALSAILLSFVFSPTSAQHYKIKQTSGIMGMNSESTIYVKGMRKRTEPGKMMGMQQPTTIEQCDLQRTIKINDKKKLYFIEPFAKDDEVIDDDAPKTKQPPVKTKTEPAKKGGILEIWNNITDTGERKQMYGFTARHIWKYVKMKPSADACYMKDSMVIKTDGWYIDLPQFNCPEQHSSFVKPQRPGDMPKPDCKDKIIAHRKGKAKLGFPLIETTTIIMGGAGMPGMKNEMTTSINTLDLSTAKLDSMLFEIPLGYTETMNEEDLQDKFSAKDMMKEMKNEIKNNAAPTILNNEQKKPGYTRIGVYPPTVSEEVQAGLLQNGMLAPLTGDKIESVSVASDDDAKKYQCDYVVKATITKVKQAGKLGGILKAIKNADPSAAQSYNVDADVSLVSVADGSVKSKTSVSGKYNGKMEEAINQALEEGCRKILKGLK